MLYHHSSRGHVTIGSLQGCVLSPLLFVLYTNECQCYYEGRHIIKFADDSAIVSLLSNDEINHGPVVDEFSDWCKRSFLDINVSKTKELIIYFRKKPPPILSAAICGQAVDVVQQYLVCVV